MSYPLTYTGNGIIKIMATSEFNGLAQAVLEHMATNDGPGSIYTANAAGNTLIGTFVDTRYAGNIGESNVTILSTEYELYQDLQTPTGTEPPLPLVYNTEEVPISLMNTSQLDQMAANILSFCVNQEGPNSYVLEPSAPSDGGTWASLGELKDIYSGGIDTKKYLFKKLTSGSYNLFRPLKSYDNGVLREFSDAEINYISKKVREQIVTTGVGQYLFQSATPSPGTWVAKGSITNTIATESTAEYTSQYTEELLYSKDSTEVYNITRDENYTGSQPVYYSGLRLIYSGIGEIEYTIQSEVNTTYYDTVYSSAAYNVDGNYTGPLLNVPYAGVGAYTSDINFTGPADYTLDIYVDYYDVLYSGPGEVDYQLDTLYTTDFTSEYSTTVFETFSIDAVYDLQTDVVYSGPADIVYTSEDSLEGIQYVGTAPATYSTTVFETFTGGSIYTGLQDVVYSGPAEANYNLTNLYTGFEPANYLTINFETFNQPITYTGITTVIYSGPGEIGYTFEPVYTGLSDTGLYNISQYSGPNFFTGTFVYAGPTFYSNAYYTGPIVYTNDTTIFYTISLTYQQTYFLGPGTYTGNYYSGEGVFQTATYENESFFTIVLYYTGPIQYAGNYYTSIAYYTRAIAYTGVLSYTQNLFYATSAFYESLPYYVGRITYLANYYSSPAPGTFAAEYEGLITLYGGPGIETYIGPSILVPPEVPGLTTFNQNDFSGPNPAVTTNYLTIWYTSDIFLYDGFPSYAREMVYTTSTVYQGPGNYLGPALYLNTVYVGATSYLGPGTNYTRDDWITYLGPAADYVRTSVLLPEQPAHYTRAVAFFTGVDTFYIGPEPLSYEGPGNITYSRYFSVSFIGPFEPQSYLGPTQYQNEDAIPFLAPPGAVFSQFTNFNYFTIYDRVSLFLGLPNLYANEGTQVSFTGLPQYYLGPIYYNGPITDYSGLTLTIQYTGISTYYLGDSAPQFYTGNQYYTLDLIYTGPALFFTGQINYLGTFTQFAGAPDINYTLQVPYTNENNLIYDGPDGTGTVITYTGPQPTNYISPLTYYTGLNLAQPDALLYTLQFFTNFGGILTYTGFYDTYYTGIQPANYENFTSYSGLNPSLPDANPYTTQEFLSYTGLIYYTGFYDSEYLGFMIQDYVSPVDYTALNPALPDSIPYSTTFFTSYTSPLTYTGSYDSVYTLINTQYYTLTDSYTGLNPALPDQNIYTLLVDVLYTGSIETIQYTMEYYTSYYTGDNNEYYATNLYTSSPILYDRSYTDALNALYDTDYTRDIVQYYLNQVFYTNDSFQIQYGSPEFYVNETYLGSYTSNSAEYGATDYNAFAQGYVGETVTFFIGGSPTYFTGIAWATRYTGLEQYVNNIYNFPEIIAYTTSKDENEYYTNSFVSYTGPSTANFTGTSYYTLNLYAGLVFTNYGGPGTDYTGTDAFLSYAGTPITYTSPTPPFFNTFVGYFDGFLAGLYTGVQDFTTYLGNLYTGITNTYTGENYTGLAPIYYAGLPYNDYYQGPAFYLGEVTTYTDEINAFYEIFYGNPATYYAGSYTKSDISIDFYLGTNFGVPGPSYYLGTTRVYNGYTSGIGYTLGNMVYLISEYAGFTGTEGSYGGYTQSAYIIGFTAYDTGPSFSAYDNIVDVNYTQTFSADYTTTFDGGNYTVENEYTDIYTSPIIEDIPVTGTTITLWRRVA